MAPAPAEDDDLDAVLGMETRSRSARRRRARRGGRAGNDGAEPVKRWRASGETEETWDDEVDGGRTKRRSERAPVFWRARDSLYFEPLVALAILAVLLVSLFAYTSNWPPVYVVESNSMQHGSGDHLGVLNAGDIVLAEKVPVGSIVTYVDAVQSGFSTYGSLGDVLLYYPNGTTSATPIVHRAILYLQYNGSGSISYNATGLDPSRCGQGDSYEYYTQGTRNGCITTDLKGGDILTLYNVGGRSITVNFATEASELGSHSGFLTLGDNNTYPDQLPPAGDPFVLSTLVEPGWVIGVARGMIPWFGAVKLLLDGNSGKVPTASWEFLGLTIAGVIFAAAGIHILLRRRAEWAQQERDFEESTASKAKETERREKVPSAPPPREREPMRPWKAADGTTDEPRGSSSTRRMSYEQSRRAHFVTPRERRTERPRRNDRAASDEDEDHEPAS